MQQSSFLAIPYSYGRPPWSQCRCVLWINYCSDSSHGYVPINVSYDKTWALKPIGHYITVFFQAMGKTLEMCIIQRLRRQLVALARNGQQKTCCIILTLLFLLVLSCVIEDDVYFWIRITDLSGIPSDDALEEASLTTSIAAIVVADALLVCTLLDICGCWKLMLACATDVALLYRMEPKQDITGRLEHPSNWRNRWISSSICFSRRLRRSIHPSALLVFTACVVAQGNGEPLPGVPSLPSYYVSVGITTVATALIVFRIFDVTKRCKGARGRFAHIVEVITESGALFSTTLLIATVLQYKSNSAFPFSDSLYNASLYFRRASIPITVRFQPFSTGKSW